jgi:membrane-bound serine protease (ClpP class)
MDPALIALCGLLVGLALLVLEFFIPSGGLILILAIVSLVAGTWGAWKAWSPDRMWMFYSYLGLLLVLSPGSVVAGLYLINSTSLGSKILLDGPEQDEIIGFRKSAETLRELIGQRGETLGLLNPGGMVTIDGTRYHCESPGMTIQPKTEVEVIEVQGNRLVVRVPLGDAIRQDSTADDAKVAGRDDQTVVAQDDETLESFDFDVPEDS